MNKALRKLITIALTMPCLVSAGEGFFEKGPDSPAPVTAAWDSVFVFVGEVEGGKTIGTFFLVSTEIEGQSVTAYFLGNRHVVNPNCPELGICKNSYLAQDAEIKDPPPFTFSISSLFDLFRGTTIVPSGVIFKDPELIGDFKNPDLALLKVHFDKSFTAPIDVIPISKSCDLKHMERLYGIGFSTTSDRTEWKKTPPRNPEVTKKRWSMGRMDSPRYDIKDGEKTYFTSSSVDAIHGGSGGPLLNSKGELVGVMSGASSSKSDGYTGHESIRHLDYHSLAVPCELIMPFLQGDAEINP